MPDAAAVPSVVLETLSLRDFRNIERADLVFPPGGVVLIGDNGQGKTNVLESVAYLGTLRSVRNARDRDLVRHGAAAFNLRAAARGSVFHDMSIGVERTTGRKKISIDGVEVARQVDALGVLPSVSWSPDDVMLVVGGPAERRRYLDVMLSLSSRAYLVALRHYRAALERRNAAIREALKRGKGEHAVSAWEPALAEHGAVIVAARREWAARHQQEFARLCAAIGEPDAAMAYEADAADASSPRETLTAMLHAARPQDLQRGLTSVGPHRDDIAITLRGHDARVFGSAGQQRTAAIALRLLEGRTLRSEERGNPVLLLDDPFAELDLTRTARTIELLSTESLGQVLLAVPREQEVPSHFQALARWRVTTGNIFTG